MGPRRFYYTEDDSTIPRIFTLETQLASKASLVEQPFKAVVASPAHEAIQEIDWKEAPPLGGYVATSMKANADLVLMTHQEDPLLATWRYGLGRSVAFTSDAKAKWGVLWVRWGGFNKFWSQVTRWALRTGTRSDTVATVSRTDNVGEVTVDAIDPKGEFINFLDSQVGVVAPDKTRTVVDLEQVGPGRYRGRFPAGQEGVYLVGMAQRRADQMVGSQLAGLVVPYGQEFRDLGVDESFLRELTELTGGGHAERAEGRVPPEPAPVAAERGHLAVAGGHGGDAADSGDRAAADRAGGARSAVDADAGGPGKRRTRT